MIYANLIFFLCAILLFSIDTVPEKPSVSLLTTLLVLVGSLALFNAIARRRFKKRVVRTAGGYFYAEKRLSVIALFCFAAVLFLGDIKYYFAFFSFDDRFPTLVNVLGLALFLLFFSLMWLAGRRSYGAVFGTTYSRRTFVAANIKANLPIVIPWVVLSFVYDLLALAPLPALHDFIKSGWADLLLFGLFLVFVIVFFPPLVRRLWGCTRLPDGPLRDHLTEFCNRQNIEAKLYVWPLFEGRVLTAGVMGLVPGLRYILLTPAIMETMSLGELEAVMAHEIGHVKRKHLLLYILLIGGFSVFAGFLVQPLLYHLLMFDWVFALMARDYFHPDTVITLITGLPLLILLILYFRYVFGYFIRNFERQADLHVFSALGTSRPLVSAFYKIVVTSGQPAEEKNWHHFGIGERVAFLERCERDPSLIGRHDRKVWRSLAAFIAVLALSVSLASRIQVPTEQLARDYEGKYIEMVLMQKVKGVEDKGVWFRLMGDLMYSRKLESKALAAYDKALEIDPEDADLLNSLAWLLLTSEDRSLRDPERALELAKRAAEIFPEAHVLDTLATAYWANDMVAEAVETEKRALMRNPDKIDFYRYQLRRFQTERYTPETIIIN